MLPVGAFKTAEQKRQLLRNAIKGVRKANKLGAWKMSRNNTCEECGHYETTHQDGKCRSHVYKDGNIVPCPCARSSQPSPALHPAPERG